MNKFLLFFISVMFCACGSTYDFVREKPSKQVLIQTNHAIKKQDMQRIETLPVSAIAYQDPETKARASSIIPKLNEAIKKNNETYGQGFKSISKSFKDYKQILKEDSPRQKNGNSTVASSIFKLVGYLILIGLLIIVIALLYFIANGRS